MFFIHHKDTESTEKKQFENLSDLCASVVNPSYPPKKVLPLARLEQRQSFGLRISLCRPPPFDATFAVFARLPVNTLYYGDNLRWV